MSTTTQNVPLVVPIRIDFAVYTKQFTEINMKNPLDHIVELDNISIDEALFKSIFYNTDNFAINPIAYLDPLLSQYISFSNLTVLGKHFCLYDEIIKNIENDLGISSSMFSPCTNIALIKEINAIKTLCDLIQTGTIVCSLTWTDIMNIIKCESESEGVNPLTVILTLSVVFTNPTAGVNATILKFNFSVNITVL